MCNNYASKEIQHVVHNRKNTEKSGITTVRKLKKLEPDLWSLNIPKIFKELEPLQ